MRKQFAFVFLALVVLGDLSSREGGFVAHLFALAVALLLYVFAGLFVVVLLAVPFIYGIATWLLWLRVHDGQFPSWAKHAARWLRSRRFGRYRLRVEKVKPEQPTPTA